MKRFTIKDLTKLTGLSRRDMLRHINGRTISAVKTGAGYLIDEDQLALWLKNIPDINEVENQSVFNDEYDELDFSNCINMLEVSNIKSFISERELLFADFFCGAGGLSRGFVEAGFKPVAYVDNFKDAIDTYKLNIIDKFNFQMEQEHKAMDITDPNIKEELIRILNDKKLDVICGGFPCQGFSLSGSGVATDPRNTLYSDMLDIVAKVKPKYIVMENVMGILSMLNGKVVKKIINDYNNIGYKVSYKVINAANYCVPQTRKRVIFIGNCIDKNNPYPIEFLKEENFITVKEAIGFLEKKESDVTINHLISKHSELMKARLLEVPIGKTLYPKYADSWKKLNPNIPAYTIKENHGAPNIHYSEPRVITAHEMALLQSFPEDYFFCGCKTKQLIQIGNAVPPQMAYAIALALKQYIIKNNI